MADITAGPAYLADILRQSSDDDAAEVGEQPPSMLEVASEKLSEARRNAFERVRKSGSKPIKVTYTLTITDIVSHGNGDAARLETTFAVDVKTSKAPPIKGRGAWVDSDGNQIGKVEKQTTIAAVAAIEKSGAKPQKTKAS